MMEQHQRVLQEEILGITTGKGRRRKEIEKEQEESTTGDTQSTFLGTEVALGEDKSQS